MFYHIKRNTRTKIFLQYVMLSQSVFHWQFLFTYIFSASLKFGICYITGQWGKFRVKNATLCLHILLRYLFVVFYQKICVFIILISFSDEIHYFQKISDVINFGRSKGPKIITPKVFASENLNVWNFLTLFFYWKFTYTTFKYKWIGINYYSSLFVSSSMKMTSSMSFSSSSSCWSVMCDPV